MPPSRLIPQIDVFAGPGGLCEGFAAYRDHGRRVMSPALSIEMDPAAHRTLKLRAFFRAFPDGKAPQDYYDYLAGRLTLDELYDRHSWQAEQAAQEAWCAELGKNNIKEVRQRIGDALGDADPWVLLGGPPCQPFSLAGRSRNRPGTNTLYSDGKDTRHQLYNEYLQIIADFWPAVFVMENVRGMLSAKYNGEPMFERICDDLRDPAAVVGRNRRKTGRRHTYTLHAIGPSDSLFDDAPRPNDFIIQCERHGIPQARHRLILIGVRPPEVAVRVQSFPGSDRFDSGNGRLNRITYTHRLAA
ncbi:DNA cytosine methyltransferase [Phycisphaeraceae bacterium D3-23]